MKQDNNQTLLNDLNLGIKVSCIFEIEGSSELNYVEISPSLSFSLLIKLLNFSILSRSIDIFFKISDYSSSVSSVIELNSKLRYKSFHNKLF